MFGIIWALVLIGLVGFISWQRSFLLAKGGNVTADLNLLQKVLPIVLIAVEIWLGIYVVFEVKRQVYNFKRWRNRKRFEHHLQQCHEHDRVAARLYERALEQGERFEPQKDLKDALWRIQFRQMDSHYIDEVGFKQAIVLVQTENAAPVPNAQVVGLFQDGAVTSTGYTDDKGVSNLLWHGVHDIIHRIEVNGKQYLGPFGKDMIHRLRLTLPPGNQPLALGN